MATKKPAPKKAAGPVKKSVPTKKAAPAKAVPAKKAAPAKAVPTKKAAPAKAVPAKVAPAKKAAPVKAAPAKKAAPVKAAPAKKVAPVKVAPSKVAPAKAAPAKKAAPVKAAPAKKVAPVKAAPVKKAAPAKAAPAKAAPVKTAPAKVVAPAKPAAKIVEPAKKVAPVKPAVPQRPPSKRPEKKKLPAVSPETRFVETSKPASSPALIRKALREKGLKKEAKFVGMPKINSTSARKYEPEFTRSVLDQSEEPVQKGPTMRYSDAELAEFRVLIQSKLSAAKQELFYLNGLITKKDSMGGGDTDNRYMTMEDGSLSMEREQLNQMASRQIDFIEKLEKAMMRVENKTYGICRVSGKLIDKARLRAVPHATLSMESKMNMNKR